MSASIGLVFGAGSNNAHQLISSLPAGTYSSLQQVVEEEVIAVAAGAQHSLALRPDGTVWIWGTLLTSQFKDAVRVSGLESIIAIAAGHGFNLALRADGTVWSWGANDKAQLSNGTINVGQSEPKLVRGLKNIVAIDAGTNHGLALDVRGIVWSWGYNGSAQLGDGTGISQPKSTPVLVVNLQRIIAIAGGGAHSLALRADGTVWAWGANRFGALGNGDPAMVHSAIPVPVSSLTGIKAITAGSFHSLALSDAGKVWAWGWNKSGQLGNDTRTNSPTPVAVLRGPNQEALEQITAIDAGDDHSLAIPAYGEPLAWGSGNAGRLGTGSDNDRLTPMAMPGPRAVALAAGALHSLIISHHGRSWGWGWGEYELLSNPAITSGHSETAVKQLTDVGPIGIAAGGMHNLLVSDGGGVYPWGANDQQQLGQGDNGGKALGIGNESLDVGNVVKGLATAVAAGGAHSLCLRAQGTVSAWGANDRGQIGIGVVTAKPQPASSVKGFGGDGLLTGIKAVAAGKFHSLALTGDGRVWAWGANERGQLGDNSVTDRATPVRVMASPVNELSDVVAIAAGDQFSLALLADGSLYAWGSNDRGQLGYPAITSQSSVAVRVLAQRGDPPEAKAIAASAAHGMALTADGKVQAWGWNKFGQVGDGTQTDRPRAVSVRRGPKVLLDDVKAIAAGGTRNGPDAFGHSLALLAHGRVTGWGHNLERQTGTVFSQEQYVTMPDSYVQSPVEVPDPSGGTTFLSLDRVVAIAAGSLHSLAIGPQTLPKPK